MKTIAILISILVGGFANAHESTSDMLHDVAVKNKKPVFALMVLMIQLLHQCR